MSVLVNTEISRSLYESTAMTDQFPYSRPLFSDGWNSLAHFLLGYATTAHQPIIFPFFIGYQYLDYKPYDNTVTDVEEYLLGVLAGGVVGKKNGVDRRIPNYFTLQMMDEVV